MCDLPIDQIGALAGVCRTSAHNALHEARLLGHIKITERPRPGRKNLTNLIEITLPAGKERASFWVNFEKPFRPGPSLDVRFQG